MELKNRIFPYPIYSAINEENDYQCTPFKVSIVESVNENHNLILDVSWGIFDESLLKELNNKNISFLLHIECPSTTFFEVVKNNTQNFKVELNMNDLNGNVQIISMLVVSSPIYNFQSPNLKGVFKKKSFYFEQGNIIGIGESYRINIEKNIDQIKKIDSLFEINFHLERSKKISYLIDLSTGKVHIQLPKESYDYYESSCQNPSLKSTLDSLFIVPILHELLCKIQMEDSLDLDETWVKSILSAYQKVYKEEITMENRRNIKPLEASQSIYNDSLISSFEYVLKVGQERTNEDD
jgi:hypothetical protein